MTFWNFQKPCNMTEGLKWIWMTKLCCTKIVRPNAVRPISPCLSLQHWVFLLSWPESWAATHNEARLLGQKSIPAWNGNQKALIAVLGPYRCPGRPGRAQPSGKLSRNQDWGENTPPSDAHGAITLSNTMSLACCNPSSAKQFICPLFSFLVTERN